MGSSGGKENISSKDPSFIVTMIVKKEQGSDGGRFLVWIVVGLVVGLVVVAVSIAFFIFILALLLVVLVVVLVAGGSNGRTRLCRQR